MIDLRRHRGVAGFLFDIVGAVEGNRVIVRGKARLVRIYKLDPPPPPSDRPPIYLGYVSD